VALLSHAHAPLFSNEQAVARVLYGLAHGRDEILVHRTIGAAVPPVIGVLSAGALEVVDALGDLQGGGGRRLVQREGEPPEMTERPGRLLVHLLLTGHDACRDGLLEAPVLANSRIRAANHLFRCTDARISQHNGRQ